MGELREDKLYVVIDGLIGNFFSLCQRNQGPKVPRRGKDRRGRRSACVRHRTEYLAAKPTTTTA